MKYESKEICGIIFILPLALSIKFVSDSLAVCIEKPFYCYNYYSLYHIY